MVDFEVFEDERWDVVEILKELQMVEVKSQPPLNINRVYLGRDLKRYKEEFFRDFSNTGTTKLFSKKERQNYKERAFARQFRMCYQTLQRVINQHGNMTSKTLDKVYFTLLEKGKITYYK